MIVVVGSRHDTVATGLVASWPDARLCAAEDLVRPGWRWHVGRAEVPLWVVDGRIVPDDHVSGVFVRRSTVYPEELVTTHTDDRKFLATECRAFLALILSATGARVVNPVFDGAFGGEALRPERWTAEALRLGFEPYPYRITSAPRRRRPPQATHYVEVVGDDVFGRGPKKVIEAARAVAGAVGLAWAAVAFDRRRRILGVTCDSPPGASAATALGRLLMNRTGTE
ncbi:MAG: hypothetical protein GY791_02165 [Alphaproteobacteria bacterium]|nr:hypothetical protein [Alphaproteobacteria bacterium]